MNAPKHAMQQGLNDRYNRDCLHDDDPPERREEEEGGNVEDADDDQQLPERRVDGADEEICESHRSGSQTVCLKHAARRHTS